MRILIVDDKKENLDLAQKELGSIKGVELILASTFEVVTDLLKHSGLKFDAVFTDCMMPGEARGINSNNPEIGKDIPYGLIISIMAKNLGIEYVSIVTDLTNHHAGPIPWALDQIYSDDTHIKCVRTKDWLKAYKDCFGEPEYEQKVEIKNKKLLILTSFFYRLNLKLAVTFEASFKGFDVVETSCEASDFLSQLVGNNKPTHVYIYGEMLEGKELGCFRKVKALNIGAYKIIVSGFLKKPESSEFDSVTYLRIPFDDSELENALKG